jgi:serine/threonine protein kinase
MNDQDREVSIYNFIPVAKLGQGSYGEVVLVQDVSTGKEYAMKKLLKEKVDELGTLKYTIAEKEIL